MGILNRNKDRGRQLPSSKAIDWSTQPLPINAGPVEVKGAVQADVLAAQETADIAKLGGVATAVDVVTRPEELPEMTSPIVESQDTDTAAQE